MEPMTAAEKQQQKLKKLMDEMNEESDGRATPIVKLGDASMASPFTAKHASVAPTTDIIQQGRSTLVTTLQMFKILGLNCLGTAYVLSVMYLDGVKLGDIQATISGIFTVAFFLFISHARPLPNLSTARPHPNIFCAYVFLSLLGQFAIHLTFLISSVNAAAKYMPEECIEPDSDFHPNLVNTVSYMDFFKDVGPLLSMQLGGHTLEGLFQVFNSYVSLLIKLEENLETECYLIAETKTQQMALLANASLLAEELLPRAALKLSPLNQASVKDDLHRRASDTQNRHPEQREWKRRLQRSADRLKNSFCQQHALDLIFTEDGDTHLSADMYINMDENVEY